jgi:hypothetical protein
MKVEVLYFDGCPTESWRLGCRVYATPQGLRGSPPAEMLREALMEGGVGADRDL